MDKKNKNLDFQYLYLQDVENYSKTIFEKIFLFMIMIINDVLKKNFLRIKKYFFFLFLFLHKKFTSYQFVTTNNGTFYLLTFYEL